MKEVKKMTVLEMFNTHENDANITLVPEHTSWARGYVSRKINSDGSYGYVVPYVGIYGIGYKHYQPTHKSTSYCLVTYYILHDAESGDRYWC